MLKGTHLLRNVSTSLCVTIPFLFVASGLNTNCLSYVVLLYPRLKCHRCLSPESTSANPSRTKGIFQHHREVVIDILSLFYITLVIYRPNPVYLVP